MTSELDNLENALFGEKGKAYAVPVVNGEFVQVILKTLENDLNSIVITSNLSAQTLISKLGSQYDKSRVKIIDWHSYQTRSLIGVEEEDGVLLCARDIMNVNMAMNKALKFSFQENTVVIIDALPSIVNQFG